MEDTRRPWSDRLSDLPAKKKKIVHNLIELLEAIDDPDRLKYIRKVIKLLSDLR